MNLDEIDSDPALVTPAKKYVDQSIGVVLMALVVFFAFAFFLSGIIRVQDVSAPQSRDLPRSSSPHNRSGGSNHPDIGDLKAEEPETPDDYSVQ